MKPRSDTAPPGVGVASSRAGWTRWTGWARCARCGTAVLAANARLCGVCFAPLAAGPAAPAGIAPTPFLGRRTELARLAGLAQLARTGRRVLVEVRGEAGAGKSRLVEEARAALPLATAFARARCRRTGAERAPFAVWRELLAGWRADAPGAAAARALARRLGVSDGDGLHEHTAIAASARAFLDELAREASGDLVVIVLEDVHAADPSTRELLGGLADATLSPLLLVATTRPELPETWCAPRPAHRIRLGPLDPIDRLRLARHWLASLRGADALARAAADRAGGSPLHIAHACRALLEGPPELRAAARAEARGDSDGPALSRSMRSLVAQRISALAPRLRRVLETASALDAPFDAALVRRLLGADRPWRDLEDVLHALATRGFLERTGDGRFEVADDLVRELAAGSLETVELARLHGARADLLRAGPAHAGGLQRICVIARHDEQAGDLARAAAGLARAGRAALAMGALAEAADLLGRAFGLYRDGLPCDAAELAALGVRYAFVLHATGRPCEVEPVLEAVDPAALPPDDRLAAAAACIRQGWWAFRSGRPLGRARDRIGTGLALAKGAPGGGGRSHVAIARACLARIETLDGRTARALAHCERLLAGPDRAAGAGAGRAVLDGDPVARVIALVFAADAHCEAGALEAASEAAQSALRIAEGSGSDRALAFACSFGARVPVLRREAAEALRLAGRGRRAAGAASDTEICRDAADCWTGFAYLVRGWGERAGGAFAEIARRRGETSWVLHLLALAALERGRNGEAGDLARRALEAHGPGVVHIRAGLCRALALARGRPSRPREAGAEAERALERALSLGLVPLAAEGHLVAAELERDAGDPARAEHRLREAERLLRASGLPPPAPERLARLGDA